MELFVSLRGALILSIFLVSIIAILVRPAVGIALILIVTLMRAGFLYVWFPPIYDLHLVQVVILYTGAAWLIHMGRYPLRINLDLILLFVFYLVICLSRVMAGTPVFESKVPDEYFRVLVIGFLIVQILRTPKDIRQALWVIVGVYLFLALRAYWRYKTDYMPIALPDYYWVNRNGFANTLALLFPIAFFLARETKSKALKWLGYTAAFWCIIGVILTYSRGGFLALMTSLLFVFLYEKRKGMFLVIGILMVAAILPRLSDKYINRIESIETYEEDDSAMGRVATNYAAINMFKGRPLLGVGAGNYNYVVYDYTPEEYRKWVFEGKSVHNIMLQILSETGIIGFTIFCLLIVRGFYNTRLWYIRDKPELKSLAIMLRIALFSILVAQQFGQGGYFGDIYLILPFIIALSLHPDNAKPKGPPPSIKRARKTNDR